MILCASPRCRGHGHQGSCTDDGCRGCVPRPAADGRNLCEGHTRWLGEDAVQAAFLYGELAERLASGGAGGEKTSGSPTRGTTLNVKAVEARTLIRHRLASWCLLIAEERGIATPKDDVAAMGDYVALHAVWLSAHGAAGDCSDEIGELAHGWPKRAAFPNPVLVAEVGPCPIPTCQGSLTGVFRAGDSLLPSNVECDWWAGLEPEERVWPEHTWTARQWEVLGRLLLEQKRRLALELLVAEEAARAEARDRMVAV